MERTRKVLNLIFWVVFICGLLYVSFLLIGGAFPLNLNPSEQVVKFDAAPFGWELDDPVNSSMQITHNNANFKEGFGALEFTYKNAGRFKEGFYSKSYSLEGLTYMEFYMKSKNPSTWQVQIKRKSDARMFHKTFRLDSKWYKFKFYLTDLKNETAPNIRFQPADIQPYLRFVDIGAGKFQQNTVWIDSIHIIR